MSDNFKDATIGNQQETAIAWLAGIVDGEGTIAIWKNGKKDPKSVKTCLSISNTSDKMILRVIQIYESLGFSFCVMQRTPPKKKRYWIVYISKQSNLLTIMNLMIPYLTTKKEVAILMSRYTKLRQTGPWIKKGINPKTGRHEMMRRPRSADELDLIKSVRASETKATVGSSTTEREISEGITKYLH